jgi:type IV pilus secretin PilQ/predicted competence protein
VTPDEAVNALLDTYNLYYVRQGDTNIYVIKSKGDKSGITTVSKIFYCSYARADKLVEVLSKKVNEVGDLTADERTNSLIVTDMADNIEKIGALIKELDSPTPQVLLEAKIMDVKLDDNLDLGVNIDSLYKTDEFIRDPLESGRDAITEDDPDRDDLKPEYSYKQPLTVGESPNLINFAVLKNDYYLEGFIQAMKVSKDAKVLSNPKLLVLNNQEASIDIVDEIPFQELTTTEEGGSMVSTSFKEVGVKLIVKPLINKDGTIVLEIKPEQSFNTGSEVSGIPVIKTSKVNTTLLLRDGETAVIGGLIRESESVSQYKVPILGDIPILGYFFKKMEKEKTRTELTVFVTANIVNRQGE